MRIKLLLFHFFVLCGLCEAQDSPIQFTKVPAPKGGVSWQFLGIVSIAEDAQGYIWFGSLRHGLLRYDGSELVNYTLDYANKNSLSSNEVNIVCPDSSGKLWIGTEGQGLDLYDPASGNFTHFRNDPNQPNSLSNDTVKSIIIDRNGIIWIGTHKGLDRFDYKSGKFTIYTYDPRDSTSLSNNQVEIVYEDRSREIWVGTGSPFLKEGGDKDKGGLNRMNLNTGKFIRYVHSSTDPLSLIDNRVGALFEDDKGVFWVGSAGEGLHVMDRNKGTFIRHLFDPDHPKKLSRLIPHDNRFTSDHITSISEDVKGNIFIGTFYGDLIYYHVKGDTISNWRADKTDINYPTGFIADKEWKTYTTSNGITWITCNSWQSLYKREPEKRNIAKFFLGDEISALFTDSDSSVWIGTPKGLILQDRNGTTQGKFKHDPLNRTSLNADFVSCMSRGKDNKIWVGTFGGGLNMFDQKTNSFISYRHNPANNKSLSSDSVSAVYEDKQNNLWLGTSKGLDEMNIATGEFTHFHNDAHDSTGLYIIAPTNIFQDERNLWIGGWSGLGFASFAGVYRFNLETRKFKHYLQLQLISSIYKDAENNIWIGTNQGLYKYNKQSDIFSQFFDPMGTDILGVNTIIEDNNKNLWVTLNAGIIRIDSNRNQVTNLNGYFGLTTDVDSIQNYHLFVFYGMNSIRNKAGDLYFSTDSGYFAFKPSFLENNLIPSAVKIIQFKLGDKIVNPGNKGPLTTDISYTKEIYLHYNENIFSFKFQALDYFDPTKDQFIYMLENYDNVWRKAGPERIAYYFNVPPGKYVFRVKAINSRQAWSNKELVIIISPPWWLTWWAYLMYAVLFIGGLWAFIYYRSRALIKEKRILEKKVELRTAEVISQKEEIALQRDHLENTLGELKITQAQLVQREKLASLGELTAGIAHEIQNPLNFVNNFSEVNKDLIDEMKNELAAGNDKEAIAIAHSIGQNEQKINDHGKRAASIVKGMLLHSRASNGQKELVNINAIADEYLRLSYQGIRSKEKAMNATIETHFDPDMGNINIISQDIGRVLLNLYNNAFYAVMEKKKHQSEGYEPTVIVSTSQINGKVEIRIKDNGIGISQQVFDKIFQPFFTTKPTGQGTGLGLSISYDIVKAHGGEIKAYTEDGEFTEFVVQIPIV